MENINVTMGIDNDAIEKLSSIVEENLRENLTDSIKSDVMEDLDIESDISNWFDYNFDIEDHIRNINLNDYIDTPDFDADSEARSLLNSYSPLSNCSTAEAFTEAVEKAVRFLLLKHEDFVQNIVDALDRREKRLAKEKVKEDLLLELKPILFEQFTADLNQYAKDLEIAKAQEILGQSVVNIAPDLPNTNFPNLGNN